MTNDSDADHAAWLADKIGALGDYAKEAAGMLRRWPEADEDEQWAIDRGADLLEDYAAYIKTVKPGDIEAHPYLPELEAVAEHLRALSKRCTAGAKEAQRGS